MIDLPLCARMNDNINGGRVCGEHTTTHVVATRSLDGAAKRNQENTSNEEQRVRKKERHLVNDSMAFIDGFYPLLKNQPICTLHAGPSSFIL